MLKSTLLSATLFIAAMTAINAQQAPYKNPKLSIELRTADLIKRMTIEEKAGQLNQLNGGVLTGPQAANDGGQQAKAAQIDGKQRNLLPRHGARRGKQRTVAPPHTH